MPSEASSGSTPVLSREDEEKWKAEYEEQVASWRAESAAARQQAEAERARWEALRASETKGELAASSASASWEKLEAGKSMPGPPNPHFPRAQAAMPPPSPSPADVRDRVAGEPAGSKGVTTAASVSSRTVVSSTMDQSVQSSSHRWVEVDAEDPEGTAHSLESSFPSLSHASQSHSASRSPVDKDRDMSAQQPKGGPGGESKRAAAATAAAATVAASSIAANPAPAPPPSATLSIFNAHLSPRARTYALVSALAINLLLPFVNGVMLGFGEIFARTVAGRFGWRVPGGAAAAVGIGAVRASKREDRAEKEALSGRR